MENDVTIKLVRSDKQEFIIDNTIWGITELEGFDTVDFESYDDNLAVGDGGRNNGGHIQIKDRTVKARLKSPALNETMRHFVVSFFNPKYTFKLFLKYMGHTRWCEGNRVGFACPNKNIYKPLDIIFTLRSVMPYMQSVEDYGQDISASIPLALFPFMSTSKLGFGTGAYKFARDVIIENDGDVETFMRCVIAANGTVKNPKIIKDNAYVRMIDTMQKGDVYEIDFVHKPPTIKKNGTNAIGKTDRTSKLTEMSLEVGKSKIGFGADSGENNLSVTFYYNKRYLGV